MLARPSDKVLNAVLLMAGQRDLLLARQVEDLGQRVFELAAPFRGPNVPWALVFWTYCPI